MKYLFTILHNSECNFWELLQHDLVRYADEKGLEYSIKDIPIRDDEEARRWKFSGSPQLLINGKDIDPMAENITNYHASGCRPVFWSGTFYEYVPIALVEDVLNRQ